MMKKLTVLSILVVLLAIPIAPVLACGGLFCQNIPVDQNAERIIFTQNHDGTMSAIVQIQYTGAPEDFSWILPIPHPISKEDIEVPETAINAFLELELATAPVFIPPPAPQCAQVELENMAFSAVMEDNAGDGDVTIFSEGEVGPYGFVVIGSKDPSALIIWLRDNNYQVTPEMEPLIDVYVEEGFSFLAMQLLPEEGVNSIAPVKFTYQGTAPMIPLRLTAVAANPDMAVIIWVYADRQTVPLNFAHMQIPDEEITFFTFGGNNYRQLLGEKANEYGGQAFITEFAAPTQELPLNDPLLQNLANKYAYVTRLNTVISPEEMTVDPMFVYDPQAKDVSNIHDLSGMKGLYDCEKNQSVDPENTFAIPFIGQILSGGGNDDFQQSPASDQQTNNVFNVFMQGLLIGLVIFLLLSLAIGFGFYIGRKKGVDSK